MQTGEDHNTGPQLLNDFNPFAKSFHYGSSSVLVEVA